MSTFVSAISARRSQYALTDAAALSDSEIVDLIRSVAGEVPSAFNAQPQRAVVLFGEDHHRLWAIVHDALRAVVKDDTAFAATEQKIAGFDAAHGTILYFDDTTVTKNLQERFPSYAANFPVWAQQANGMLQFAVWSALAEAGIGANVQHYNPLIDDAVRDAFGIPADWKLIAQMPFGEVTAPAGEREHMPLDEQVQVRGL
ncbi:nitroreductase family protein [Bifidobacterium boum]|uniref:Nitroreductase domain containing protein n=1 Tax=Bifidobacterium boum TaxID=78343 RepID=A0A086ZLD8_9BIFI|nr:nitroreductase family protein [Bifidobacterium boum]KFI47338.1 nitroreductase domain containing protein [Bifidobacterium boum]